VSPVLSRLEEPVVADRAQARQQPVPADAGLIRRRLATQLRQGRERAGLTQTQVARQLDWAATTVIRIEGGKVSLTAADVTGLGHLYQTDTATVAQWLAMAAASRWQRFTGYRDVVPDSFVEYLALEAAATRITQWAPLLLPDLLQNGPYADGVAHTSARAETNPDAAERRATLTAARQAGLRDRPTPPDLVVIVDEAVIERLARGPDVMLDQLEDLRRYVDHPYVTVHVADYAAGFHLGLLGAFTLLEFGPADPPAAFAHPQPYTASERSGQLHLYQDVLKELTATDPAQLGKVLDRYLTITASRYVGAR